MIMPFDLFGKKRYIYTVEDVCQEDSSVKLEDGAKRIFINTHGQNDNDVSPEFIALMRFIEYNEGIETQVDSAPNLAKIKGRVAEIKASEEVGVRFMQRWEEEALIRHEGKEEGMEKERLSSIRNVMASFKISAEEAMDALKIPKSDQNKYMSKL